MPLEDFSWKRASSLTQGLQMIENGEPAVNFADVLLGQRGALELSKLLSSKASTTLSGLNLNKTHLNAKSLLHLSKALSDNNRLVYLSLSQNNLSANLKYLGSFLSVNRVLKELDLDETNLQDNVSEIAKGLSVNKGLKILSMNNNGTTKTGLKILSDCLKSNKVLRELFLFDYHAKPLKGTQEGIQSLIQVLKKHNTTLTCLGIICYNQNLCDELDTVLVRNVKIAALKDSEQMRIFTNTLESKEKGPWMRSKLVIFGQKSSGKSSLINSFITSGPKLAPREGDILRIFEVQTKPQTDGSTIWRSAGFKRQTQGSKFSSFNHAAVLASRIAIEKRKSKIRQRRLKRANNLVRTATQLSHTARLLEATKGRDSKMNQIESFKTKYLNRLQKSGTTLTQLSAESITDLEEMVRKMSSLVHKQRLGAENDRFYRELLEDARRENSQPSRTGLNFSVFDLSGDVKFQPLQSLFLGDGGTVSLLVFSVADILSNRKRNQCVKEIVSWLKLYQLRSPNSPLIVVGSHSSMKTSDSSIQGVANALMDCFLAQSFGKHLEKKLVRNKALRTFDSAGLNFFPVDNKTGAGLSELRAAIEITTLEQEYVYQQVPVNFLRCLDTMLATNKQFLSLETVGELAQGSEIELDQVGDMLRVFHDLGVIIYFPFSERLRSIVVLNPEWLVSELSNVLVNNLHYGTKFQRTKLRVELRNLGLLEEYEKLFEKGIISFDLLNYFFARELDFLMEIMRESLLLCDYIPNNRGSNQEEKKFVVPSMLPENHFVKEDFENNELMELDSEEKITCRIEFSILPVGLCQKLVCSVIDLFLNVKMKRHPVLTNTYSILTFKNEVLTIEEDMEENVIDINRHITGVNEEPEINKFELIFSLLNKVNHENFSGQLLFSADFHENQNHDAKLQAELSLASKKKNTRLVLDGFLKNQF